MAELSRPRAGDLSLWLLALGLLAPAAAQGPVELVGTWHVLVHYTDDDTSHPEQLRWDDRIWVFSRKGSRLQWIEYPIVVFGDETGRFERRRGQYARVLGAWEPSEAQLRNIDAGLEVNTRGSKQKSLRGSDEGGWRTLARARPDSASIITYQEDWSIEGLPQLPVFTQRDLMGSGRSEMLEGVTRYETRAVESGGDLLTGSYQRDGSRHGTFQMRRSGPVGPLEEKTQSEIQAQGLRRLVGASQEARRLARESLREVLEEGGFHLADQHMEEIVTESIQLFLQGADPESGRRQIQKSIQDRYYAWVQRGAEHDDASRYKLPFDPDPPRQLTQGVGGDLAGGGGRAGAFSHKGRFRYAFDFAMPVGTEIVAARAGQVVRVVDGFEEGGPQQGLAGRANVVTVRHAEGTFAVYAHLSPGIFVREGQEVRVGDPLGRSGNTGFTTAPHLHFSVLRADDDGDIESVPIRFDDGSEEGYVPVEGHYYGGQLRRRRAD